MIKAMRRKFTVLLALATLAVSTAAMADNSAQQIHPPASRTAGTYNSAEQTNSFWRGIRVFLNIASETGTSTLDVKVQVRDHVSGIFFDLPGAALDQKSADTGDDILTIYPGIAETANESVSDHLGRNWRLVAVVGGTAFNFSTSVQLLE